MIRTAAQSTSSRLWFRPSLPNPAARRNISLLNLQSRKEQDLEHAVGMVKAHDPAGVLPGRLLPLPEMKKCYFATRSFWVESGLRFGTSAKVNPNASPLQHLEWWQEGIDHLYNLDDNDDQQLPGDYADHPTFRLLQQVLRQHDLSKTHFDAILTGRRQDLNLKQYPTLESLLQHAELSCGNLAQLVLESGNVTDPNAHEAARLVGTCHGLTNALRLSIPVISTTGKLIVPEDLCLKYGVKSPRYLLSSLGMGDEKCRQAFHNAIRDIVLEARSHLEQARELKSDILAKDNGANAVAVLLPGIASETFLNRLERHGYDLTDRDLRRVGMAEHFMCASRMVAAYYRQTY